MTEFVVGILVGSFVSFLACLSGMREHIDIWRCWENDDGTPKREGKA